jgi:hypothetical protein
MSPGKLFLVKSVKIMPYYLSFILFVATSFAAENLPLNEGLSVGFDSGAESGLNSVPLDNFDPAVSNQPPLLDDAQSSSGFSISTLDPIILGDDQDLDESLFDKEDDIWTALSDNDESFKFALDTCPLDQAFAITKKRLKPRDALCINDPREGYFPDNFRKLGASVQEKIFHQFMCPNTARSALLEGALPVCSSSLPENTRMTSRSTPNGPQIYYILLDSFLCTCCADPPLVIMLTNPCDSVLDRCGVLRESPRGILLFALGAICL